MKPVFMVILLVLVVVLVLENLAAFYDSNEPKGIAGKESFFLLNTLPAAMPFRGRVRASSRPSAFRSRVSARYPLLSDDLDQHALPAFAVEFAIEDFLPRTEIELAFRNRNDDFASHDGSFQMSVRVVFGPVVSVLVVRLFRGQFFQPHFKVAVQTRLVVVD